MRSGRSAARAERANPCPRPIARTSALESIAAASAIPIAVSAARCLLDFSPRRAAQALIRARCGSASAGPAWCVARRGAISDSATSLPSLRCRTRSAIAAASGSWVTITTARRSRLRNNASTVPPLWASRLPVGSSASTSSGSLTSALAIANRCCSPPESSCGRWSATRVRPSSSISCCARRSPPAGAPGRRAGSLTFSAPVSSSTR